MPEIYYNQAIRDALREEMIRDPNVFIMGEDIGVYGGIFGCTAGLVEEFGEERVIDTPICENSFVGAAVGAAQLGKRPVVEVMFIDFITLATDQIINQAAKRRYMFGGQTKVPIVVRTEMGTGRSAAAQHSQCLDYFFVHVPGLKVVEPSTPYDAKGLLKSSIRDDNPVVFIEHKLLYPTRGYVPEEEYTVPLGVADVKNEGEDITVVANSYMVYKSVIAAKNLEKEGISVEVVDPRTLLPLDTKTISDSVKKTGRILFVEESCGGIGDYIASKVLEDIFYDLDAPPKFLRGEFTPVPFNPKLDYGRIPDENKIARAVKEILRR